jgi:hypothetical protein
LGAGRALDFFTTDLTDHTDVRLKFNVDGVERIAPEAPFNFSFVREVCEVRGRLARYWLRDASANFLGRRVEIRRGRSSID